MKTWKKVSGFLDKCIWINCGKLSLLCPEYLSKAVNVLTNGAEISDLTERNVFKLNLSKKDKNLDQSAVVQISAIFWNTNIFTAKGCSKRAPFRRSSKDIFQSSQFLEHLISSEVYIFWQNFQNLKYKFQKCNDEVKRKLWFFR